MLDLCLNKIYNVFKIHNAEVIQLGKRRKCWSEERYIHDLNKGVSQGTGENYIPGITIHDFPSKGISSRIPGRTAARVHHCLSRNEEYYFIIRDNDPNVADIWEQFWLPLSETLPISSDLNIRHPRHGSFPNPISTDFVIQLRDGTIQARTIKETKELSDPRILEKFAIEYAYWKKYGIDWKIVTEHEINRHLARNYQWLRAGPKPEEVIPDPIFRQEVSNLLLQLISENKFLFSAILEIVEEAMELQPGTAMTIFKHLVLTGQLALNLEKPINFMDPLAKED